MERGSAGRGRAMDVDTCALDCCARNTEKEKYSPAVTCHDLPDGSGRFYLFRYWLLSSVTVKRRKSWLLAASALASSSLGISGPALAQCVRYTRRTLPALRPATLMPPASTYNTNNTPINLTLQPGVNVTIPAGSPGVNAVNAANTTGPTATSAPITITADGVTILNNNNPTGNNQTGLRIQSSGDATITATNTTINVSGTASDFGRIRDRTRWRSPP